MYKPNIKDVTEAKLRINGAVTTTPLIANINLSERFEANILLKREDLQIVRSYKIRGAYNMIKSLDSSVLEKGVVCASAGNHAQGVAYSCRELKIPGYIYMPSTTPKQKIEQVKMFGREFVNIVLSGDTFDAANSKAQSFAKKECLAFIPPFDHPKIIEGQATVAVEIMQQATTPIDYIFVPIGGGGLASGIAAYIRAVSPATQVIGVEPEGAASMIAAIRNGSPVTLDEVDTFVDGAAVRRAGDVTYSICRDMVDQIVTVPEGKVCSTILELYNRNAIVVEPAGALAIAALDGFADKIRGKNCVCVVSGSNNDITRTEEIRERSLLHEGLKHYFIVRFPQRSGALLTFVKQVLGEKDDITHFAYSKKNNRERGPAIIGIELQDKSDFEPLIARMQKHGFVYEYLNDRPDLFQYLIL